MNKLRALFVAVALLTAACGSATISGSQVKSASGSGNIRVDAGANAGTNVSTNVDNSDLGPRNPTPHKPGSDPVQQSQAPAPAGSQPTIVAPDRCNGGGWTDHDAGRTSTGSANHPLLPACAVQ